METIIDKSESIYELIPPPVPPPAKKPIPKAKYDAKKDTFMTHLAEVRPAATFGYPLGSLKPHTEKFLKKHKPLFRKDPGLDCCRKEKEKAPIPHEPPVMGLSSGKNFINENAVEIIHASPRKVPKHIPRSVERLDYGKVPGYLVKLKRAAREKQEKIDASNNKHPGLAAGPTPDTRRLEESERNELIILLKEKWQQVNQQYQKVSFTLDTQAKKERKEELEDQLMQIEKDILTLSRRVILVTDKGKSLSSSSHSKGRRRHLKSHVF